MTYLKLRLIPKFASFGDSLRKSQKWYLNFGPERFLEFPSTFWDLTSSPTPAFQRESNFELFQGMTRINSVQLGITGKSNLPFMVTQPFGWWKTSNLLQIPPGAHGDTVSVCHVHAWHHHPLTWQQVRWYVNHLKWRGTLPRFKVWPH